MKFKNFTQAYFLIKNNGNYTYSLGERAKTITFNGSIAAIIIWGAYRPKSKAPERI